MVHYHALFSDETEETAEDSDASVYLARTRRMLPALRFSSWMDDNYWAASPVSRGRYQRTCSRPKRKGQGDVFVQFELAFQQLKIGVSEYLRYTDDVADSYLFVYAMNPAIVPLSFDNRDRYS